MNDPVTVVNNLSKLSDALCDSATIIHKVKSELIRFQDDLTKKNSLIVNFEEQINAFKNDLQQKNEELDKANLTIFHLSESNHTLTIEKEKDKALLLEYQGEVSKALELAESYKNELEAKTKLAETYMEDDRKNKSYINGLNIKIHEFLNDTAAKWCNVFGGAEIQNQLKDTTKSIIPFQTQLESSVVLADSLPALDDRNFSMFQRSFEGATLIHGGNCLENDKAEERLDNSEDNVDGLLNMLVFFYFYFTRQFYIAKTFLVKTH